MESALITAPPIRSASASAARDLPLAVGPAISTASKLLMAGTMFVLNVIGKGAAPDLFRSLGGTPAILSPGFAFDLPVENPETLAQARDLAKGQPLDINLVATANRRKKLLVADMDSTII